jgi:hypothetical protein
MFPAARTPARARPREATVAWSAKKQWVGTIDELRQIETYFGVEDPIERVARYDAAIEALRNGALEDWLGHSTRAGVTDDAREHFRAHWLSGAVMPDIDPDAMATTIREGFAAALTAARDNALPMSAVWVMLGADANSFEIEHVVGASAVTVVIAVPYGTNQTTGNAAD